MVGYVNLVSFLSTKRQPCFLHKSPGISNGDGGRGIIKGGKGIYRITTMGDTSVCRSLEVT